MEHTAFFRQFALGARLDFAPGAPLRASMQDMALLKKAGFNLVVLQADWASAEPTEGRCDFAAQAALIEHAASLDLGVCAALDCAQAPGWLYEKYMDGRLAGSGEPRPRLDHPGVLAEQERLITRWVETLGKYANLAAWNVWPGIDCGTCDGEPILRARAAAIRAADPLGRPVFAQQDGFRLGFAHDWAYARAQDFLSAACHPARGPYHAWDDGAPQRGLRPERAQALANELHHAALTFDLLRSCNRPGAPLWASDLQGGPAGGPLHPGRAIAPEDVRRWMLTAAGAGASGVAFAALRNRAEALLEDSRDSTPRFREAARVGAALQRHAGLFAQSAGIGAEVGILVNEENAQFAAAVPPASEHLAYATRGWHRLLWDLGVAADFVNVEEVSAESVQRYRVLVLPFPLSLSEAAAQQVGSFVYAGGGLICEAPPGRYDERGAAQPGGIAPVFSNLFGATPTGFSVVREPEEGARWTPPERTWGEFAESGWLEGDGPLAGVRTPANVFVQTFELQGSQPVIKFNGRPAGTFRVGRLGWAWLIGSVVGHSGTAYAGPESRAFVRRLLEQCQVHPAHAGRLLLRKRAGADRQAWFLTNPTGEPVTDTIEVGAAQVEDLLGEPFEREGEQVTLTVAGLDVRVLIITM